MYEVYGCRRRYEARHYTQANETLLMAYLDPGIG